MIDWEFDGCPQCKNLVALLADGTRHDLWLNPSNRPKVGDLHACKVAPSDEPAPLYDTLMDDPTCLNYLCGDEGPCGGELRTDPSFADTGTPITRCERHYEIAADRASKIRERYLPAGAVDWNDDRFDAPDEY